MPAAEARSATQAVVVAARSPADAAQVVAFAASGPAERAHGGGLRAARFPRAPRCPRGALSLSRIERSLVRS